MLSLEEFIPGNQLPRIVQMCIIIIIPFYIQFSYVQLIDKASKYWLRLKECLGGTMQRSQPQAHPKVGKEVSGQEARHIANSLPAQLRRTTLHVSGNGEDQLVWDEWHQQMGPARWRALDCSLKGPMQKSLQAFGDITYDFYNDRFVTAEKPAKRPKQANRHQVEKCKLGTQHRALKQQWKGAPNDKKEDTLVLIDELRQKIRVISRVEYEREMPKEKRKCRERFYLFYQFCGHLLSRIVVVL